MAAADYYLCDSCLCKTFYDADLSYSAGSPWPNGDVGQMFVLCKKCADELNIDLEGLISGRMTVVPVYNINDDLPPKGFQFVPETAIAWLYDNHPDVYEGFYNMLGAYPVRDTNREVKIGHKEGDICGVDGCTGVLGYEPVHNCTCFINPPCSKCVNNPLVCLACGRDGEDNTDDQ